MAKDYSTMDKDGLLKVIEKLESRKKYGLIWDEEKTKEKFEKESENALPVLKEVKSKEFKTDSIKPTNILIEGDNYHALSVLNYTHQNKIDVIYIDPPYNTGNKDFKFNDDFVDKDDAYRHSKWLSFMSKRLRLAKSLLKDEGIIYISIDDIENYNLKILCDSIFGENKFIANLIWKSKSGGANDSKFFAVDHEYILVYANNPNKCPVFIDSFANVTTSYNREDEKGVYALDRLDKQSIRYSESLNYEIKDKNGNSYYPAHKDVNNPNATWRWGKETVLKRFDELVFENGCVYTKNYKSDDIIARSLLLEDRFGRTRTGKTELFEMFGKTVFNNPKPSKLILNLCRFVQNKNITVLDFFAGSGTTGHAVLQLNKQDGGNRKFILCTNNENNICKDVTFPRINNVINGYKFKGESKTTLFEKKLTFKQLKNIDEILEEIETVIGENKSKFDKIEKKFDNCTITITGIKKIDGTKEGLGGNLKFFKTAFVKKSISRDDLKIRITRECTEMLCLREGVFNEVCAKPDYYIFKQNERIMGVYYAMERDSLVQLKKELDKLKGIKILYCFTLDPLGLDKNDFTDWQDVTLEPIPQKILDIYEQIYEY